MTSSAIKILAVVAMLVDHIGYYFSPELGRDAPLFRLIGRVAFPLFIFAFVWGYYHTKSRKKYLTRLYAMGIFMAIFNLILLAFWGRAVWLVYPQHNIFITIMLIGLGISAVENLRKNCGKSVQIVAMITISTIANTTLTYLIGGSEKISKIISGFLPSVFAIEYDYWFVLLGILLYFARNSKLALSAVMLTFSGWIFLHTDPTSTFQQGAMIFALPIMLMYNGKKGVGLKWFFYIFYPLHILILWLIFAIKNGLTLTIF